MRTSARKPSRQTIVREGAEDFVYFLSHKDNETIGKVLAELTQYDNSLTLAKLFIEWFYEESDERYWEDYFEIPKPKDYEDIGGEYGLAIYNKIEEKIWKGVNKLIRSLFN